MVFYELCSGSAVSMPSRLYDERRERLSALCGKGGGEGARFETFFSEAPRMNPSRALITAMICGVRLEDIKEPTMREIGILTS